MATKMSWADIADEEDLKPPEPDAIISRHGIKIKKQVPAKPSYIPPHLRDKSKSVTNSKEQ
jgi:hypothetical protein